MKEVFSCLAIVFVVTLVVFSGSIRHERLNYDDNEYVLDNPHVRDGLTAGSVRWALTSHGYAANWHPLTWISLMADVTAVKALWPSCVEDDGEWKRPDNRLAHVMHLHNVVLHATVASLLFYLLFVLARGKVSVGWIVLMSLFWAIHPLRVEVVCWISERKELTSCLFMLLSVLFYIGPESRGRHLAAFLFAAAAMAAKPVAVTLPVILFAWDMIFRRRIRWLAIAPFFLLSMTACYLTYISQTVALDAGRSAPLASRLTTIFVGPLVYVRQTLWPVGLSPAYTSTVDICWPAMIGGVALVVAMLAVCLVWLRRRGELSGVLAFGVAWSYVGLLPMLGIVKVGGQEHSDRYTYWITCGVCAVVVLYLSCVWPAIRVKLVQLANAEGKGDYERLRKGVAVAGVAILAALACATNRRMTYWHDTVRLYRDALPKSWNTQMAYALNREIEKNGAEARAEGEMWLRACADRCNSVLSFLNLAEILLQKPPDGWAAQTGGEIYAEACSLVDQALCAEPDNKRAKALKETIAEARKKALKHVQGK